MTSLPSYIDPMIWSAFVEQRKAMKVPFTQGAQKLVVMKLMKMHQDGYDANASLEKSVIYGYRSVFPDEKLRLAKDQPIADPALMKIVQDRKAAAPMPEQVRARLAALRKGAPA